MLDTLWWIYDFAISNQKMNFKDCEDMDLIAYLDYLDYFFNRKKEENNNYDDLDY